MKSDYIKKNIPKAIREQCWILYMGKTFEGKCYIPWCKNDINVFNFTVGHNIPESKGGTLDIHNLRPICMRCNQSMSNNYTITEWINTTNHKRWNNCSCIPFFKPRW
jgi:5-methylcytosine-specific restriction endonuclease McrA